MTRPPFAAPAVVAAIAACLTLLRPAALEDANRWVYDALARTAPSPDPPPPVLIVAIDDASLASFGRWPWSRHLVARLVTRLHEAGAAVIALDVLFAESERSTPPDGRQPADDELAAALARAPTVAGYAFVFGPRPPDAACRLHAGGVVERQAGDEAPSAALPRGSGVVCTLGTLTDAAGASGHLNAVTDSDGLLRRLPLLITYRDRIYPSLALAAVQRLSPQTLVLEHRGDGQLALDAGPRTIPLGRNGEVLLRYTVRRTETMSAADVMEGRVPEDALRDRIVFVGAMAVGLDDLVATPVNRQLPGVEVHATLAANLLAGIVNHRPERADLIELAATILCGLLVLLAGRRFGLRASAACAALLVIGAWSGAMLLLHRSGAFLTPLYPALAMLIGLSAAGLASLAREQRRADRERTRRGDAQRLIVQALTTLTETRDPDTGRHARRTQEYTRVLAEALARRPAHRRELNGELIALLATLAPLHDIGKVGVSDAVLRKPGALTTAELAEMRRHPGLGHETLLKAEALAGVHDDEVLKVAKEIVHTHHEFWDGTGYPSRLRGADIPLSGRIVALVDAYDAMVVERTYRKAMSHAQAVDAIVAARGRHFDPEVVDAFLGVAVEFARIAAQYAPGPQAGSTSRPEG